jgi:hypothetical protein
VLNAADALLRGQPLKSDDPWAVADVIDELNARSIDALQAGDYRSAQKAKAAVDGARLQFRQRDRDLLHREVVARLSARHKEAVEASAAAKGDWKRRQQQLLRDRRDELRDLDQRHDDEHRQLEQDWAQPDAARPFEKRSPALLQNRQIEQYMLLSGMYDRADQMRRINAAAEKGEVAARQREMATHFAAARANLNARQRAAAEKLRADQDSTARILAEHERKEMTVRTRRVEATERVLAEEKDFQNFAARTYRHPPDWICPATVMTTKGGTDDLPVIPRGKTAPAGSAGWAELRRREFVTSLPLPPLPIRHYRPQSVIPKPRPKASNS